MLPYNTNGSELIQHLDEERCRIAQVLLRRSLCSGLANIVHEDGSSLLIIFIIDPVTILVSPNREIAVVDWELFHR